MSGEGTVFQDFLVDDSPEQAEVVSQLGLQPRDVRGRHLAELLDVELLGLEAPLGFLAVLGVLDGHGDY